jgi:hypothetical protein
MCKENILQPELNEASSTAPPKQKAPRSDSGSSSKKKPVRRAKSNVDGSPSTAAASNKKTKKRVDRHKSFDGTGPVTTTPTERPRRRAEPVDDTTTPNPRPTTKKEKLPLLSAPVGRSKAAKELEATGATIIKKPRRKAVTRQHTFDGTATPSNLARHSEELRRASTDPTPVSEKKKPSKKQAAPTPVAAAPATKNKRKVQFGAFVSIPPPEINPKAKPIKDSDIWYSKEDLKTLMDYEVQISMRGRTGKHSTRCCTRGIEHLLEGRNVGAKVQQYVRTVLQQQTTLKEENLEAADRAKQLRTFCQYFTKEDRKRATKMGFQDASEVSLQRAQEQGLGSSVPTTSTANAKPADSTATRGRPRRNKSLKIFRSTS